jgi:hypothetical protein
LPCAKIGTHLNIEQFLFPIYEASRKVVRHFLILPPIVGGAVYQVRKCLEIIKMQCFHYKLHPSSLSYCSNPGVFGKGKEEACTR